MNAPPAPPPASPRLLARPGGTAFGAACAAALLLAGCGQKEAEQPAPAPAPAAETPPARPPAASLPAPVPPLGRAELLAGAAQAASAFAEGREEVAGDALVGRRFRVRVPFGCTGPAEQDTAGTQRPGLAGWSRDYATKAIQLKLEPADWSASGLFAAEAAERWEAVEGFWVTRPWMAAEACPKLRGDPLQTEPTVSPQTVGIAAVFERGGSRIGRRDGRAYSFTVRAAGDEAPTVPAAGYRLVLEGRIAAFPSGRAFACRAAGPDERPVCVAAAQLDRVAFEGGDAVLTEWRPG
jgi:hypothetical protein